MSAFSPNLFDMLQSYCTIVKNTLELRMDIVIDTSVIIAVIADEQEREG
jgi:hypothetical protein